jgi:hypothetical protein
MKFEYPAGNSTKARKTFCEYSEKFSDLSFRRVLRTESTNTGENDACARKDEEVLGLQHPLGQLLDPFF